MTREQIRKVDHAELTRQSKSSLRGIASAKLFNWETVVNSDLAVWYVPLYTATSGVCISLVLLAFLAALIFILGQECSFVGVDTSGAAERKNVHLAMATSAFHINSGALQTISVGPADLVNAYNIVNSAWGWLGGLDGVRNIAHRCRIDAFAAKTFHSVFKKPQGLRAVCGVLTMNGLHHMSEGERGHVFGDDFGVQIAGFTVCALAHKCGGPDAVQLFMRCLAPALISHSEHTAGIEEALHSQLNDNCDMILAEGAARKLPQRFARAIDGLQLPCIVQNPDPYHLHPRLKNASELALVGGLVRWVASQSDDAYATRSASVARCAACLKEVGFQIGQIVTWDGRGRMPSQSRAVVLVTSGSSETDELSLDAEEFSDSTFISHYRWSTVGSMLTNALRCETRSIPEVFQDTFNETYHYIDAELSFVWQAEQVMHGSISVRVVRSPPKQQPTSVALRLAAFCFPHAAEFLAPCYKPIATRNVLETVNKGRSHWLSNHGPSSGLIEFRVVTASILLAIVGKLAGVGFTTLQHSTQLSLDTEDWIHKLSSLVDGLFMDGLQMSTAAFLVATIHCGVATQTSTIEHDSRTIGWRNGIYAVFPALLRHMEPGSTAIGFACVDEFIGNLPVGRQGIIRTGARNDQLLLRREAVLRVPRLDSSDPVELISGPTIANPSPAEPDIPLYLNIERSPSALEPEAMLCARVGGVAIGFFGIFDVLGTILRALNAVPCPGHHAEDDSTADIVPASFWIDNRAVRDRFQGDPTSTFHTYVPAKGDRAWSLYLAGNIGSSRAVLCLDGCFRCAERQRQNAYSRDGVANDGGLIVVGFT